MKKAFTVLLLVVVTTACFNYAVAEFDPAFMSDEELYSLRIEINEELAARNDSIILDGEKTIIEVFPDKKFAKYIRDEIGAFSINDVITQDDLDGIKEVFIGNHDFGLTSLEGIQYLGNLEELFIYWQEGLKDIPDCFDNMPYLETISLKNCAISELPDSICNLLYLKVLDVSGTSISHLPSDIGNLSSLNELSISNTKITELPASVRQLDLEKFYREGLDFD